MRISVNTETEELEELRHAVAIIEDAIKRRENPDLYEEDYKQEAEEKLEKKDAEIEKPKQEFERLQQAAQQTTQQVQEVQQRHENLTVEKPSVEGPKPHVELNLTKPPSYSQIEQAHQEQKPKPISSRREERGTTPDIDISALSMSSYGESKEGRKIDSMSKPSNQSSQFSSSSSSFSSTSQPPTRLEPRFESRNNESHVREIVNSLRNQRSGQPIQMSDIVSKARTKNISEQETRNLVSKLQREGSI